MAAILQGGKSFHRQWFYNMAMALLTNVQGSAICSGRKFVEHMPGTNALPAAIGVKIRC